MKNKKLFIFGIVILAVMLSVILIGILSGSKKEKDYNVDVSSTQKEENENVKQTKRSSELSTNSEVTDLDDLQFYEEKEEILERYPFIYHNDKKYYKQFNTFIHDNSFRGDVLGDVVEDLRATRNKKEQLEEGDAFGINRMTPYLQAILSDELILTQNMNFSVYDVYSSKQLYYTKFDNIIKDRDKVTYQGIYLNYFNEAYGLPLPDSLDIDFLEKLREVPFTIEKYNQPINPSFTDSLIVFEMTDGIVYGFRAWYDNEQNEVFIIDNLNKKQYIISDDKEKDIAVYFMSEENLNYFLEREK